MLGMIEINLLPAEFRPREKTNLPLMVTVAAGVLVVGGIIFYGINKNNELAGLKSDYDRLEEKSNRLKERVKAVSGLENRIAQQKARQDTIIEISQSKVMWSLKLQQFSQILGEKFDGFWITGLRLSKSRTGGTISMNVSSTGSSLRDVAKFREAIKTDPNFFYHFGSLDSTSVQIVTLPPGYNYSERMNFSVSLPLRSKPKGKKKKRKK